MIAEERLQYETELYEIEKNSNRIASVLMSGDDYVRLSIYETRNHLLYVVVYINGKARTAMRVM